MNMCLGKSSRRTRMQLTPREFDKLLIYIVAEIVLMREANCVKLNYRSRPNRSHRVTRGACQNHCESRPANSSKN